MNPQLNSANSTSAEQEVNIRMYTAGLGDCFLVSFKREQGGPFQMVIDCGVFRNTDNEVERMTAIVKNIKEMTGGNDTQKGHVHLLVVTHEHWDHLSGFTKRQAFKIWDEEMTLDEIWMSWVEDPGDPVGNSLRMRIDAQLTNLRLAHKRMTGASTREPAFRAAGDMAGLIGNVLDFFGDEDSNDDIGVVGLAAGAAATGAKGPNSKASVMTYLRNRGVTHGDAKVTYHEPGETPYEPPGVPGVRFYVLGPPKKDNPLLGKEDPTEGNSEVYELLLGAPLLRLADSFAAAFPVLPGEKPGGSSSMIASRCFPIDERYQIREDRVKRANLDSPDTPDYAEFFHCYYYGSADGDDDSWRRIDDDWLDVGLQLVSNLDTIANNCSLVLAIELQKTQDVLLFAADAQVGNWLSWQDVKWTLQNGGEVTGPGLLGRTVFYKVGHHGSHNATLKDKGLEQMVRPSLVAMVPVNADKAHKMVTKKTPNGWDMPATALWPKLVKKTRGRVVRADTGLPTPEDLALAKLTQDEMNDFDAFKQVFEEMVEARPEGALWMDLAIRG
jgi:hypothetical protein